MWLNDTEISDTGLCYLKGFTKLQYLVLPTQITDAGLLNILSLHSLETLKLDGTQVTDVGLNYLEVLDGLVESDLSHTGITDNGLVSLGRLTHLQRLDLRMSKVSHAGVEILKQKLPLCTIFTD